MGRDKRGVDRGQCKFTSCECRSFEAGDSHKCRRCGHGPTHHDPQYTTAGSMSGPIGHDFSKTGSYKLALMTGLEDSTSRVNLRSNSPVTCRTATDSRSGHRGNIGYPTTRSSAAPPYYYPSGTSVNMYTSPRVAVNHTAATMHRSRECENPECRRPRYFDADLGEFPYCSPECRRIHYIPEHDARLDQALHEVVMTTGAGSTVPHHQVQQPKSSLSPKPPSTPKPVQSSPSVHRRSRRM